MAKRPASPDLKDDEDHHQEGRPLAEKKLKTSPKVKSEPEDCNEVQQQQQEESEGSPDSDVEVVEHVEKPTINPVQEATSTASNGDDIEVVGTVNECRLPHMRQHCPENKFVPDVTKVVSISSMPYKKKKEWEDAVKENAKRCDLCYCYICDKPAKECQSWDKKGPGGHYSSHCHASDKGAESNRWQLFRKSTRDTRENAPVVASLAPGSIAARRRNRTLAATSRRRNTA